MQNYKAKCKQCHKPLKDPADNPIYVVRLDAYFCDQKCLTKERNKNE